MLLKLTKAYFLGYQGTYKPNSTTWQRVSIPVTEIQRVEPDCDGAHIVTLGHDNGCTFPVRWATPVSYERVCAAIEHIWNISPQVTL